MRRTRYLGLLALVIAACAADTEDEVVVSAAASLRDVFGAMEVAFEADHPGIDILLNFGPSSALRIGILESAPVDVFASAGTLDMVEVAAAGLVPAGWEVFGHNTLQIAVPAGNPAGVSSLEDFGREDLLIGLCAQAVPCGRFAREVLASSGVTPSVDSLEPDARALLTKLETGELDAGITYVTDVASSQGVEGLEIPEEHNVIVEYPVAALVGASGSAAEFVAFVLSDSGRTILLDHGFITP